MIKPRQIIIDNSLNAFFLIVLIYLKLQTKLLKYKCTYLKNISRFFSLYQGLTYLEM